MQIEKPDKAAFFDVDNTIINLKSMFSFMAYFFENSKSPLGFDTYDEFINFLNQHPCRKDRKALNRIFYQCFKGWRKDDVTQASHNWFDNIRETLGDSLWIEPVVQKIRELRQENYLIVAVSGSCNEILNPLISHLALDHCLATNLLIESGRYTGEIETSMIGRGKALAIEKFCQEYALNQANSIACGDHYSDLFMLESVGNAYVVAGDPPLEKVARNKSWEILASNSCAHEKSFAHV